MKNFGVLFPAHAVLMLAVLLFTFMFVPFSLAHAQYSGQYWCNGYWSSYPCTQTTGYYSYNYGYNYGYGYPYYGSTYPYNYGYPQYNYNYGYGYGYTQPQPTCTISVSHGYGYPGDSAVISWSSQNATSASISPSIGTVALSGSTVTRPISTTTFRMTVWGPGGTSTCDATYYPSTQQYHPQYRYYNNYNWNYQPYYYGYPQYQPWY